MEDTLPILMTCHNRKKKTLECLNSLYEARNPKNLVYKIFLVDDGSTDDTEEAVRRNFPDVIVIKGSGNLFWAGGMRLAFDYAKKDFAYNGYLLINDDVILHPNFLSNIFKTKEYCLAKFGKGGLYSGLTIDGNTGKTSYGGSILTKGLGNLKSVLLQPSKLPQPCHLTNANILYVEGEVVDKISFFDHKFVHGIADYDYSLRAYKAGFPVYLAPNVCGFCENDHNINWSESKNLGERIAYLKSPLGLAYEEYLFFIKRHFSAHFTMSYLKLWGKTLFPSLWNWKTIK